MEKNCSTYKDLQEAKAELDYLMKTRRPRLARLLMYTPFSEGLARCSIENAQALVDDEIAKLVAVIMRVRIIRGVDIERSSVGTKSKIKFLAESATRSYRLIDQP